MLIFSEACGSDVARRNPNPSGAEFMISVLFSMAFNDEGRWTRGDGYGLGMGVLEHHGKDWQEANLWQVLGVCVS